MTKVLMFVLGAIAAFAAQAQPQRPMFQTTKVEGTDNVYVFRYGNHQSMFVVTSAGVIATDPIGRYRPEAVTAYLAVRFLMRFFETNRLTPFAVYCLLAGIGCSIYFFT